MTIRVGGNIIAGAATGLDKANTDMDNLTSQGQNIANWSSNVTNCITEIQQDIKLELNNGTLTLKAGSKVYIPNGFETTTQYAWFLDGGTIGYQYMTSTSENPAVGDTVEYDKDGEIYTITDITVDSNGNVTAIQVNGLWYNRDSSYDKVVNDTTKPIFDVVVVESDVSTSSFGSATGSIMLCLDTSRNSFAWGIPKTAFYSGNTAPSLSVSVANWYDTASNIIKSTNDTGATWNSSRRISLPFSLCTRTSGSLTSIDQVFNSFGYIGSTIFALPGVKGLIPNGRNADGSLKNINFTVDKVMTFTFTSTIGAFIGYAAFQTERSHFILSYDALNYWKYNGNKNIFEGGNETTSFCYISKITTDSSGVITSFTPKTAFHAVDYNDKSVITGWGMPSNRCIDLTLGANGSTYTAPANGWVQCACIGTQASTFFELINGEKASSTASYTGGWARASIPVKKGDIVTVFYGGSNFAKQIFRFAYAEGEN